MSSEILYDISVIIERISFIHPMILLISKVKSVLLLSNFVFCVLIIYVIQSVSDTELTVSNIPVNKEKLVQVLTFFTRKNCSFACAYTVKILLWVWVVWAAQLLQILKYMCQGENNPLICKCILSIVKQDGFGYLYSVLTNEGVNPSLQMSCCVAFAQRTCIGCGRRQMARSASCWCNVVNAIHRLYVRPLFTKT